MPDRTCSVEGCARPAYMRGWCHTHYRRWLKHGDMAETRPPRGVCSIVGCERPHEAGGWCQKHYARWKTHGDPLHAPGAHGEVERRFWSYVDKHGPIAPARPDLGECWIWTGHDNGAYGQFWDGEHQVGAHRFAYELEHGSLPDGFVPDHLCFVTLCVRGTHLEAVTQAENVRRARKT